jgi:hypothetical protein
MGTTETTELKNCILDLLERLGWSQKRLAKEIYWATYDDDDPVELKRHEERLKKELQRSSTKPERLKEYIKIISQHHEFTKLDIVRPQYVPMPECDPDLDLAMKNISMEISDKLKSTQ